MSHTDSYINAARTKVTNSEKKVRSISFNISKYQCDLRWTENLINEITILVQHLKNEKDLEYNIIVQKSATDPTSAAFATCAVENYIKRITDEQSRLVMAENKRHFLKNKIQSMISQKCEYDRRTSLAKIHLNFLCMQVQMSENNGTKPIVKMEMQE